MNTINKSELPAPGTALAGGFFTGLIRSGDQLVAIITAPKATGQLQNRRTWGETGKRIDADNCHDGRQNTVALAAEGNTAALEILALVIDGHADWYWPARDEKELQYRYLKPTAQENYCSFRDGANTHSVPVGHDYTKESPAQTTAEIFQAGNAEAFDEAWYWSSTQYSANGAYVQDFSDGTQGNVHKDYDHCVRAVRRLLVIE